MAPQGGRLVRMVHRGGKARSTGRIARCVVLWLWNQTSKLYAAVRFWVLRAKDRAWQAGHV